MRAFNATGFSLRHTLVWVKNQFVIGQSDYHFRHEPVLYGWIENGPHYFTDDRTQDSVFEVDKPHVSELIATQQQSRRRDRLGFLSRIRDRLRRGASTRARQLRRRDRSIKRGRLPRKARQPWAGAEAH